MRNITKILIVASISINAAIFTGCKEKDTWKDVDIDCPMGTAYDYKITNRSTAKVLLEIERTDKIPQKISLKNNETYEWSRFYSFEEDEPESDDKLLMPFPENKKITVYFNGKSGYVFDGDDYKNRDIRDRSNYREIEFKRVGPCPPDAMFEYTITADDYNTAVPQ